MRGTRSCPGRSKNTSDPGSAAGTAARGDAEGAEGAVRDPHRGLALAADDRHAGHDERRALVILSTNVGIALDLAQYPFSRVTHMH